MNREDLFEGQHVVTAGPLWGVDSETGQDALIPAGHPARVTHLSTGLCPSGPDAEISADGDGRTVWYGGAFAHDLDPAEEPEILSCANADTGCGQEADDNPKGLCRWCLADEGTTRDIRRQTSAE